MFPVNKVVSHDRMLCDSRIKFKFMDFSGRACQKDDRFHKHKICRRPASSGSARSGLKLLHVIQGAIQYKFAISQMLASIRFKRTKFSSYAVYIPRLTVDLMSLIDRQHLRYGNYLFMVPCIT